MYYFFHRTFLDSLLLHAPAPLRPEEWGEEDGLRVRVGEDGPSPRPAGAAAAAADDGVPLLQTLGVRLPQRTLRAVRTVLRRKWRLRGPQRRTYRLHKYVSILSVLLTFRNWLIPKLHFSQPGIAQQKVGQATAQSKPYGSRSRAAGSNQPRILWRTPCPKFLFCMNRLVVWDMVRILLMSTPGEIRSKYGWKVSARTLNLAVRLKCLRKERKNNIGWKAHKLIGYTKKRKRRYINGTGRLRSSNFYAHCRLAEYRNYLDARVHY